MYIHSSIDFMKNKFNCFSHKIKHEHWITSIWNMLSRSKIFVHTLLSVYLLILDMQPTLIFHQPKKDNAVLRKMRQQQLKPSSRPAGIRPRHTSPEDKSKPRSGKLINWIKNMTLFTIITDNENVRAAALFKFYSLNKTNFRQRKGWWQGQESRIRFGDDICKYKVWRFKEKIFRSQKTNSLTFHHKERTRTLNRRTINLCKNKPCKKTWPT